MKRYIFILILVFVSSLVFAGGDLRSYLLDYDLDVEIHPSEFNGRKVLYMIDYNSEDRSDYIYNVYYLLQVLVFYYEDFNSGVVTMFYESSDGKFSLILPDDFLVMYLNAHKRDRYDLLRELLDPSFKEYEQRQQPPEQLPPPKKYKLFNFKK